MTPHPIVPFDPHPVAFAPPVAVGRPPGGGAAEDELANAVARELVRQMIGRRGAGRGDIDDLVPPTLTMLRAAHARFSRPVEPLDAWLRRLLAPGIPAVAGTAPVLVGVAAVATVTRITVEGIVAAAPPGPVSTLDPEPFSSPALDTLPQLPTAEAIEVLREEFGIEVARKILEVARWGEIDCTPSLEDIEQRLRIAGVAAVAPPPLTPPGWIAVPPTKEDGRDVHRAIQDLYLGQHESNLVVADRVVYLDGQRLGTLAEVTRGEVETGHPDDDNRLELLDAALRFVPRSFERSDITDMTERTIYEVKPRASAPWAVVQMWAYQAGYNAAAQELPYVGKPSRRHRRGPVRYDPNVRCPNPELLQEGRWLPIPPQVMLPPRPGMPRRMAVFFSVPGLPGLLLYDLFVETKASEDDLLLRLLQALAALGIGRGGRGQQKPDDQGQSTFPEREQDRQRPAARDTSDAWEVLGWIALAIAALALVAVVVLAAKAAAMAAAALLASLVVIIAFAPVLLMVARSASDGRGA